MQFRPFLLLGLAACSESGLSSLTDTSLPDTGLNVEEPPPAEIAEPVADAGPDQDVGRGALVVLDGSQSYDPANLTPLVYQWTVVHKPTGTASDLSDIGSVSPTFQADVEGTWVLDLTVQNSAGVWDTTPARSVVHVTNVPPPPAPVANAGADVNVETGTLASLSGSASTDPSGLYPLTYQWTLASKPGGSSANLVGTGDRVDIVPDVAGDYTVQLTVQNTAGVWDATPDRVVVHASAPPVVPPESNAGADLNAYRNDTVTLDGTGSYDPNGLEPLTYRWSTVSVPTGSASTLGSTTSPQPSFVPDKVGTYTFELVVTNSAGTVDPTADRVRVQVTQPPASEPIADAGDDQSVQPLVEVTLDGTGSYDPQGLTPLAYQWSFVSRPSGSTTALSSVSGASPTFFVDVAGRYELDLTVRNSAGIWDATPDRVVIEAVPADGFYVQVTWDSVADLDLHLLNGTSALFSTGDCSYCNMAPAWNNGGTQDDPSLDWDAIYGWGPETTTITSPSAGSYEIKVHYFGQDGNSTCVSGCPVTNATARVYLGGVLAATYTKTLRADGEVWNVAKLDWPSRALTARNTITTTALINCQ